MSVTLSPQLEQVVRRSLESGRYRDETDVLGEALRLLEERDRADRLRASIAEADAEIDRGEGIAWTRELMDRLTREAEENSASGKPVNDDVKP